MVAEDCVVHYPGNHFLSGDHVGRTAILDLYRKLYKIGIEPGTFHRRVPRRRKRRTITFVALIKYTMELGMGQRLTGEAVGVFPLRQRPDDRVLAARARTRR